MPKATKIETVTLADGRTATFTPKQKYRKESVKQADGSLAVRVDFRNGTTSTYPLREDMIEKFAGLGAEQRYQVAGKNVAAMQAGLDTIHKQLHTNGVWSKQANGLNGASVLAQALAQIKSKPLPEILEGLKKISHKDKMLLREHPSVLPVIQQIEAANKAKAPAATTNADSVLAAI